MKKKINFKGKFYKFRGKVSYAQVYTPDTYLNKTEWKLNLHPDKDTIDRVKEAGIQLKLKDKEIENVEGKFFTFKRPVVKEFPSGTTYFSPPMILDENGDHIVHYRDDDGNIVYNYSDEDQKPERIGEPVLIGNGSDIEIEVYVYPTKNFGNGCQLQSVKILDLIEYVREEDRDEDEDEEEEKSVKAKQTEKTPVKKKAVSW